jgi:hypothetical protein
VPQEIRRPVVAARGLFLNLFQFLLLLVLPSYALLARGMLFLLVLPWVVLAVLVVVVMVVLLMMIILFAQ